jgi:hypothetical protein
MESFSNMDLIGLYPIVISQSRYGGVYEGGEWFCMANCDFIPDDAVGDDEACADFWASKAAANIGIGKTPNDAFFDMLHRHDRGLDEARLPYRKIVQQFETTTEQNRSPSTPGPMRSIRLERTDYFDRATGFAHEQ